MNFYDIFVKMLIYDIFCLNNILFIDKKNFKKNTLLFYKYVLKYICKSVVDTDYIKQLIIFPLII